MKFEGTKLAVQVFPLFVIDRSPTSFSESAACYDIGSAAFTAYGLVRLLYRLRWWEQVLPCFYWQAKLCCNRSQLISVISDIDYGWSENIVRVRKVRRNPFILDLPSFNLSSHFHLWIHIHMLAENCYKNNFLEPAVYKRRLPGIFYRDTEGLPSTELQSPPGAVQVISRPARCIRWHHFFEKSRVSWTFFLNVFSQ